MAYRQATSGVGAKGQTKIVQTSGFDAQAEDCQIETIGQ
jgi:hypothetical protein